MSVQKFVTSKENPYFTTVSNKIIQGLKNQPELLGFYIYLLSLPPSWSFHKKQLKETCGIGIKKLERFLNQLAQMRLVEIAQMRNEKGHFAHFDLRILNGESFKIIDLNDNCAPCVKNRTAVNRRTDLRHYKRNIEKTNIKKETSKSFCASNNDAHTNSDTFFFEDFWKIYPRKKDKFRAKEIWKRNKYDKQATLIFEDVRNRILNESQWKEEQFIPHPSTYLRNERWNDEITLAKSQPKKETGMERVVRLCLN